MVPQHSQGRKPLVSTNTRSAMLLASNWLRLERGLHISSYACDPWGEAGHGRASMTPRMDASVYDLEGS